MKDEGPFLTISLEVLLNIQHIRSVRVLLVMADSLILNLTL